MLILKWVIPRETEHGSTASNSNNMEDRHTAETRMEKQQALVPHHHGPNFATRDIILPSRGYVLSSRESLRSFSSTTPYYLPTSAGSQLAFRDMPVTILKGDVRFCAVICAIAINGERINNIVAQTRKL